MGTCPEDGDAPGAIEPRTRPRRADDRLGGSLINVGQLSLLEALDENEGSTAAAVRELDEDRRVTDVCV
jgi:hypothetical protein